MKTWVTWGCLLRVPADLLASLFGYKGTLNPGLYPASETSQSLTRIFQSAVVALRVSCKRTSGNFHLFPNTITGFVTFEKTMMMIIKTQQLIGCGPSGDSSSLPLLHWHPEYPCCPGVIFLLQGFWVFEWWITPLRLLFSSFNNVLQLTSCFSAANLAKSIPCQVLIWVTWRPLDLNFWWVITESEVSNFLISSGSQKGVRLFYYPLIRDSPVVKCSEFWSVCRQKENLTAQAVTFCLFWQQL